MSGPDHEFEDFLKRRKPLFRRDVDDGLEPPAELDRIVLRQAREAIEGDRPLRMFGMPRWAAPVAIAATLVLGMSIVFKAGLRDDTRIPQVTVENASQRYQVSDPRPAPPPPAAAPAMAPEPAGESDAVVMDLRSPTVARNEAPSQAVPAADSAGGFVSPDEAARHSAPPPPPVTVRNETVRGGGVEVAGVPVARAAPPAASETTPWRRDAKAWQAEIQRLRNAGDVATADAEQAEYNRQQRAYAASPDR